MPRNWAIDTLDARGGLAFASFRDFGLADERDRLREAPCVWIAPPYFEPEPVVSRAVAWSADRGAFQIGVFHDGEEVQFDTIEAVIEFVRRTYLRSAGGDGLTGGGAPLPPTPPPDSTPDFPLPALREDPDERSAFEVAPAVPPPGRGGAGSAVDVLRLLKDFGAAAKAQTGLVAGAPARWTGQDDDGLSAATAPPLVGELRSARDQFGWASLLLLRELLLRLPPASRPAELLVWERSACTLGKMITGLGTWDWLMLGPYRSELRDWADLSCARWQEMGCLPAELFHQIHMLEPYGFLVFYSRLFGGAAWRVAWAHSSRFPDHPPIIWAGTYDPRANDDPVEDLSRLPLPSALARCVRRERQDDVNVFQLLGAASGAPLSLGEDGVHGRDATAVLLFAAGWLLQSREPLSSLAAAAAPDPIPDLEAARVSDLGGRAWAWLARSMPRLVFPHEIEILLGQASALRYGGEANPGAGNPEPRGDPSGGGSGAVVREAPDEAVAEAPFVSELEGDEVENGNERKQNRKPPFMTA